MAGQHPNDAVQAFLPLLGMLRASAVLARAHGRHRRPHCLPRTSGSKRFARKRDVPARRAGLLFGRPALLSSRSPRPLEDERTHTAAFRGALVGNVTGLGPRHSRGASPHSCVRGGDAGTPDNRRGQLVRKERALGTPSRQQDLRHRRMERGRARRLQTRGRDAFPFRPTGTAKGTRLGRRPVACREARTRAPDARTSRRGSQTTRDGTSIHRWNGNLSRHTKRGVSVIRLLCGARLIQPAQRA